MNKRIIVVLGMHRSGTSAVTRSLETMGVDLGERLMPPSEGNNDKGFWEDLDVVALDEELLAATGVTWHSLPMQLAPARALSQNCPALLGRALELMAHKVADDRPFGVKDPRLCRLLPFWSEVFHRSGIEATYVHVIRNPLSVRDSLVKRDGFESEKCHYLWLNHTVSAVSDTPRGARSVVVDYDRWLAQPIKEMDRLATALDLTVDESKKLVYTEEFLQKDLRHSVHGVTAVSEGDNCPPLAQEIYLALYRLACVTPAVGVDELHEKVSVWKKELLRVDSLLNLTDRLYADRLERDEAIWHLNRDKQKQNLALTEKSDQVETLTQEVAVLTPQISALAQQVAALTEKVAAEESRSRDLDDLAQQRKDEVDRYMELMMQRDRELRDLHSSVALNDEERAALAHAVAEIRSSTSWRLTAPVRVVGRQVHRAKLLLKVVPMATARGGGFKRSAGKALEIFRREGIAGIRSRLRSTLISHQRGEPMIIRATSAPSTSIPYRPYFLNPFYNVDLNRLALPPSIAIHLHLFYEDLLPQMAAYLANVPYSFDLFVSVRADADSDDIRRRLTGLLPAAGSIIVENVENRGRDIAPFIIQFGTRLRKYDILAHVHTKKSPHSDALAHWMEDMMLLLFGGRGSDGREIAQIINLLKEGANVVYPGPSQSIALDSTGWADNYHIAAALLERYTKHRIEDYQIVEFPQGMMFWARADSIAEFLTLPLTLEDFPSEPIAPDGTIAHALERIFLILASGNKGTFIRLHTRDTDPHYLDYEEQQDFSHDIPPEAPKVLAYYLPQFHPTPENDEWHGTGFTEWTKVRAANPLFVGHYQQHIPHPDIGHYLLDSPDVLRRQAEMMARAGVHGQIFYHYWFGGRLILEKPAAMLLANPDVHMPFCFCWANENWTRRWDGNENEILLGQNYSHEDAAAFIQYLIPFFRDSRYIRVEGRPLLMVYRPSSIPDAKMYVSAWREECARQGIKEPYVVAVLTRGATDPREFDMDAGTERVLHDWTGGRAPEISADLKFFEPFKGSVLSYPNVADSYIEQSAKKPFTYFRSAVPIWDNTARYGNEAYVVHGSTPGKFQAWMETLVKQSYESLPADRRFIVVNAWNEWAEGAHLEPDTRHGYAYLNSVGRALSGQPYGMVQNADAADIRQVRVNISIGDSAMNMLVACPTVKTRFMRCLATSSLFDACQINLISPYLEQGLKQHGRNIVSSTSGEGADYSIMIGAVSYFAPHALEQMVRMGVVCKTSVIVANNYNANTQIGHAAPNGSVDRFQAYGAPLALFPAACDGDYRNFRICPRAKAFHVLPDTGPEHTRDLVTTIIRVHKSADLDMLNGALLSLLAMQGCVVRPLVAAQDLSAKQKEQLHAIVHAYQWSSEYPPIIRHYESENGTRDLRSRMLNESLLSIKSGYAAILDYDDMLFASSYAWLISRLKRTRKAVSFGRVYVSLYDPKLQRIVERRRVFEYGHSYEEFLAYNHAPIHSFLLDMDKIDMSHVVYFDEQKYLEDYLLTLQLFTEENADWESLSESRYIGDYVHVVAGNHTLAILDSGQRDRLLADEAYLACENHIAEMKARLKSPQTA